MELDIKVIEFTNNVDIHLGLDKEFKDIAKDGKFREGGQINYGYILDGSNFITYRPAVVTIRSVNDYLRIWSCNNLSVAYLAYLMNKYGKQFSKPNAYIGIQSVTKEVLEYFDLTKHFPKQLLEGSDFITTLGFLPFLIKDSRSRFYNKKPKELFEEL